MIAGVFWACRKELREEVTEQKDILTLEQARAFFENSVAMTKVGGYLSSNGGASSDLNPGDFTPRWDRAHRAALNYQVDGVDVVIDADYTYSAVFSEATPQGDTLRRSVPIEQKLVVNRWRNHPKWLGLYAYIATIVPTPDYYARHKNFGRDFVNLGDKNGFSGFVIYHRLDGLFVNADRYVDGEMTEQVYDEGSLEADRRAFDHMMSGVALYGDGIALYSAIETDEVTVTACLPCKMQNCNCKLNGALPCNCLGSEPDPPKDTTDQKPDPPGGGGSGPGNNDDNNGQPPINRNDDDCTGSYASNISAARTMLNMVPNAIGYAENYNQWSQFLSESNGAGVEYGLSMYRITQTSGYVFGLNPTAIGTANNVGIPMLESDENRTYTVATIHTHTNGLPPSGRDVYELVNLHLTRPQLNDVYVITGSGSSRQVYVLHVEDRDAMTLGRDLVEADPITNEFTSSSAARHYYDEAMARFEGSDYSAEDKAAYSLAYALEKCNLGIKLLRGTLTANGSNIQFSQIQMDLTTDATNLKNCN